MRFQRISRVDVVAVTVIVCVLAVVLYLVFTVRHLPPRGLVYGINNTPLPHAVLRFHDPNRLRDVQITASGSAAFFQEDLDKIAYLFTNGYAVVRFMNNSKGHGTYVFSPRGTQLFVVQDRSGHPVRNVSLLFSPGLRTYRSPYWAHFYRTTDKNGTVTLTRIPMAARYLIQSNDKRWKVKTIGLAQGAPEDNYARVPVTLIPSE